MSFYTLYERMLLSEAYFPKAGDANWLVTDFVNQLAADINMLDTLTPQHLRGFMEVCIFWDCMVIELILSEMIDSRKSSSTHIQLSLHYTTHVSHFDATL